MTMPGVSEKRTPYAVICNIHSRVYLTEAEYTRQLEQPDALWKCPCGRLAIWDDDNYESFYEVGIEDG